MPLFETLVVDEVQVRSLVLEHWSLNLGDCLKTSQNHTFTATDQDGQRHIVRVTPDATGLRHDSIEVEIALLEYLHSHQLQVCCSVWTRSHPARHWIRSETGNFIIVVFEWASGEPVDFTAWRWMTERDRVVGLGRWFARFHALSRRFVVEHPDHRTRARHWTQLHDGILADVCVDPRDRESSSNPRSFGLIHGDVNPSNYYWCASTASPHMFDWDQAQISWFLYDLSAPIWTVIMLRNGGNPFDRSPVPQADVDCFTDWLVAGYESGCESEVSQAEDHSLGKVDREALQRMVGIRRQLYKLFCGRAIAELSPDLPMAKFCMFMNSWLDKELG